MNSLRKFADDLKSNLNYGIPGFLFIGSSLLYLLAPKSTSFAALAFLCQAIFGIWALIVAIKNKFSFWPLFPIGITFFILGLMLSQTEKGLIQDAEKALKSNDLQRAMDLVSFGESETFESKDFKAAKTKIENAFDKANSLQLETIRQLFRKGDFVNSGEQIKTLVNRRPGSEKALRLQKEIQVAQADAEFKKLSKQNQTAVRSVWQVLPKKYEDATNIFGKVESDIAKESEIYSKYVQEEFSKAKNAKENAELLKGATKDCGKAKLFKECAQKASKVMETDRFNEIAYAFLVKTYPYVAQEMRDNSAGLFGLALFVILILAVILMIPKIQSNLSDATVNALTKAQDLLNSPPKDEPNEFSGIKITEGSETEVRHIIDNASKKNRRVANFIGSQMTIKRIIPEEAFLVGIDNFRIIRTQKSGESPGDKYRTSDAIEFSPYDAPYELPDENADSVSDEKFILPNTVETYSCEKSTTCTSCHGNKKCRECQGKGRLKCDACHGQGFRVHREFKKNSLSRKNVRDVCYSCKGEKWKRCRACDSSGQCLRCHATGKITCERCEGLGKYQSYDYFETEYKNHHLVERFYDAEIEPKYLEKISAENLCDEKIYEYDSSKLAYTNTEKLASLKAAMGEAYFNELYSKLEKCTNDGSGRIGRISSSVRRLPITTVEGEYDTQNATFMIYGKNNVVWCKEAPKASVKSQHAKVGLFTKLFGANKRRLAYISTVIYFAKVDGHLDEAEEGLIAALIEKLPPKQKEIAAAFLTDGISDEQIAKIAKPFKNDLGLITIAWHGIIADNEIADLEKIAFEKFVTNFPRATPDVIEKLKNEAIGYARVKPDQLLEAYISK